MSNPSQVNGTFTMSMNFGLTAPQLIGSSSFPLSIPTFVQGALTYPSTPTNGQGIGKADQLFATQMTLVNGTPQDIDLYALGGGNDAVGNAFTMANVKLLAIQNLGVDGSAAETDTLSIGGDGTSAAWTSFLGTNASSIIVPGPAVAMPSPGNFNPTGTPTVAFWAPGDVGWAVGASTTNHKLQFTSNASGHTIRVNIYIVGSTGT